jgi:hypothetical protein
VKKKLKKKYTIITHIDSFDFPLREAHRKIVWALAKREKENGNNVHLVVMTKKK